MIRRFSTLAPRRASVPFRKTLSDRARLVAAGAGPNHRPGPSRPVLNRLLADWDLTVGIEIHAELNTQTKLFSPAASSISDTPNTHVAHFDASLPGSMPAFSVGTLVPALRAAIALNCDIEPVSTFDRKHYFYPDQPCGYQITQYYHPFATNGHVTLFDHDTVSDHGTDTPSEHGSAGGTRIDIARIQLEQDTAKTNRHPHSVDLLDLNRASQPLIEIITGPCIHHPSTAASYVRKVQSILDSVDALKAGMEFGGLRVDVNVSVRPKDRCSTSTNELGQRTEVKNINSLKAVEKVVELEMARQVSILEAGGIVEAETRGWTIGGGDETVFLRKKEGTVDYRFMPDPDVEPLIVSDRLVDSIRQSMPTSTDEHTARLTSPTGQYRLSTRDARLLINLDDGDGLEYFLTVVDAVQHRLSDRPDLADQIGRTAAKWVIHQLGAVAAALQVQTPASSLVPAESLATIVASVMAGTASMMGAREVLHAVAGGDPSRLGDLASSSSLSTASSTATATTAADSKSTAGDGYATLAAATIAAHPDMAAQARKPRGKGKLMWLVGQMIRAGDRTKIDPKMAEAALVECLSREE